MGITFTDVCLPEDLFREAELNSVKAGSVLTVSKFIVLVHTIQYKIIQKIYKHMIHI